MKNLFMGLALAIAFMYGEAFEKFKFNHETNTKSNIERLDKAVMIDYIIDVVDETDFWYEVDSTNLAPYEEDSSEWYLSVIIEYTKWDCERNK